MNITCKVNICVVIHEPSVVCVCVCLQFADGVYLVLLMGLLENYFVPLYNFYLTPESFEQKVSDMTSDVS